VAETYYITTPIYYVNDMPHIGHIYTTVMADIFARYRRMRGSRVRFLTGTDEHGQKIAKAARGQGIEPLQLADRVVARYHDLWKSMNISHDDFVRTTETRHMRAVGEMIRRISVAGDIYAGEYVGWYCAGAEAFIPDSQVQDGRDVESGYPVERLSEPSYFFRLSAYQDRLLEWYRSNPDCIRPQTRYNEVVRFVESGLKDLSISRASLRWGVPFPDDQEHVVYVWLDALTNYVSALGFGTEDDQLYQEFWPANLHLMGKDILRFHCVYWPAFLMSAGLELPRQVFGHGWWLRDEAKMSKSIGNVVRPDSLIERFGADAVRYFLAREMAFGQDASFSDEAFLERYNADLANALGNTASRTVTMVDRYLGGTVPRPSSEGPVPEIAEASISSYIRYMDELEPHRALEATWQLLATINGFLQERQPWSMAKRGKDARRELESTLYAALEGLRITSLMIDPVLPTVAERLRDQIGASGTDRDLLGSGDWGQLPAGASLGESEALFPRVDVKAYISDTAQKEPTMSDPEQDLLTIDEFARIRLVVATVLEAERIPNSKKLVRLLVDIGEQEPRQLVAGIAERYEASALIGRQIVVVANLKPAKLMGVESRGMLLAATVNGDPYLLGVDEEVPNGSRIR
jgi:methionyl-tRNA synthetase